MNLGLRSRALRAVNSLKAKMDVGEYWYWLPESEVPDSLPIRPLVEPLRYDVIVRRSLFEMYRDGREAFRSDPGALVLAAREHDYRRWFDQVLVERFEPGVRGDREASDALFSKWVRKAAALYDSIADNGFDPRHPIIPFTGKRIARDVPGIDPKQRFFLGDGCHRLACLMVLGYEELPREYVRVKCFSELTPLDNTSLLAPSMEIRWPQAWAGVGDRRAPVEKDLQNGAGS